MPWLMNKTMTQVNHLVLGRTLLDSIIRDVVHQRIDDYDKLEETLRRVNESLPPLLLFTLLLVAARGRRSGDGHVHRGHSSAH